MWLVCWHGCCLGQGPWQLVEEPDGDGWQGFGCMGCVVGVGRSGVFLLCPAYEAAWFVSVWCEWQQVILPLVACQQRSLVLEAVTHATRCRQEHCTRSEGSGVRCQPADEWLVIGH